MLQLVVLQVKGLQRVEILESLRRYYLDAERRIMPLRILFNFVITVSKVRLNSIKIELIVFIQKHLLLCKVPFLGKIRELQTALQEGKMDGT
jgi:hypothetical protein